MLNSSRIRMKKKKNEMIICASRIPIACLLDNQMRYHHIDIYIPFLVVGHDALKHRAIIPSSLAA